MSCNCRANFTSSKLEKLKNVDFRAIAQAQRHSDQVEAVAGHHLARVWSRTLRLARRRKTHASRMSDRHHHIDWIDVNKQPISFVHRSRVNPHDVDPNFGNCTCRFGKSREIKTVYVRRRGFFAQCRQHDDVSASIAEAGGENDDQDQQQNDENSNGSQQGRKGSANGGGPSFSSSIERSEGTLGASSGGCEASSSSSSSQQTPNIANGSNSRSQTRRRPI